MPSSKQLLVTIATYNERENLPSLVERLFEVVPGADLLVVDDNSPDGTGRWVAQQAAVDRRVACLHRPAKLGLGSAVVEALAYAVAHEYAYVVTLDADGSHDPREIPQMVARMCHGTAAPPDVVIGSRYVRGGSAVGWPRHRRVMSWAVNVLARLMLGVPVHDCSGAFRCMRVSLLRRVDLTLIRSQGYACLEELLWRFRQAGARFEEVPIVFVNRQCGMSKITARECVVAVWTLLRVGVPNWLRLRT